MATIKHGAPLARTPKGTAAHSVIHPLAATSARAPDEGPNGARRFKPCKLDSSQRQQHKLSQVRTGIVDKLIAVGSEGVVAVGRGDTWTGLGNATRMCVNCCKDSGKAATYPWTGS